MLLRYVGGFATLREQWYAISPLTGEIAYTSGCIIVFYNFKTKKQYHIINPKSLPYTSLTFSKDGRIMLAGESMTSHWNIHHFEYNSAEQMYTKKVLIKTLFHSIERVTLSPDNSIFVINGVSADSKQKDVIKYEVYDLEKK